jgi:5-methylcytosine-specific restriction endonuclease McrA
MKSMTKPENDIDLIIADCISNLRDEALKNKFSSCIDFIKNYSDEFEIKMKAHDVHSLTPHSNVNKTLTKEEMVKLYTDKFSKKSQPGRKHYDKLMISAQNGQCPYCGIRPVATLDHFLTKQKFPTIAISPINLVPSCRDCNSLKGEKQFTSYVNTHLHPYYDYIENEIWIEVVVQETPDIMLMYKVRKPSKWEDSLFQRVSNHFDLFNLQKLFCLQAVDEISSVEYKLKKLKKAAGANALYLDLIDTLESCEKVSLNGWKSALYRALSKSKWFIESYI